MKTCYIIAVSIFSIVCRAQEITNFEKHGSALNISGGVCYYKYVGYSSAVLHADYEIQIGNSLTVAPSVSVYSYDGHVLWGDDFNQARDYSYSENSYSIRA